MENITVEKYIAGIRQELLPKYHLSKQSIEDIASFYRHRLSDTWNPSLPFSCQHLYRGY